MSRNVRNRKLLIAAICFPLTASLVGAAGFSAAAAPSPLQDSTFQGENIFPGHPPQPLSDFPADALSPVPLEVHEILATHAFGELAEQVNTVEWDDDAGELVFHAQQPVFKALQETAAALTTDYRIQEAEHSKADLLKATLLAAERWKAVAGEDGSLTATPSPDGSSITFEISEVLANERVRGSTAFSFEDSVGDLGIRFTVEVSETDAAARYNAQTPFAAGNMTRIPAQGVACTNGFYVGQIATNVPFNLTADHCSSVTNQIWYVGDTIGTTTRLGYSTGQANGGTTNTDHMLLRALNPQEPYVLTGGHNNGVPKSAIRGWTAPVLNDYVCYSGSRSGLQCGNIVAGTETTSCYPTVGYCYYGLTRTYQQNGISAAGQGDSGGPAIQVFSDANGMARVYASGIISGIASATGKTCQGDQGRLCSDLVIYAPISKFFYANQGYGLAIVP